MKSKLVIWLLTLWSVSGFSQDHAMAYYQVEIEFSNFELTPSDSILSIEFLHGIDGGVSCSVTGNSHKIGYHCHESNPNRYSIFESNGGIGSCARKFKPPTIYLRFAIHRFNWRGEASEFQKIIPIVFFDEYLHHEFALENVDLSDYLGLDSKAVAVYVDEIGSWSIKPLTEVVKNPFYLTMIEYEQLNPIDDE